jgi:RluA family pseudouridine synthase
MPKLSFQYAPVPQGRETLVEFLTRRFRYHDAEEWSQLVQAGHVMVNGQRVPPQYPLRGGHQIVYERLPLPEPSVDARFAILYEDEQLLALEKSSNLPTSPSGKYWEHCLVHIAQRELGLRRLYAVHRLDRETSGINLLAKTPETARVLGRDFQQGRVRKAYTAVLRGHLGVREAYVSVPLMDDPHGEIRIRQVASSLGREARTRFALLARLPHSSLVRAEPLTGRTHQIRAHAFLMGHPVWGDKLYGRSAAEFLAWVARPRQGDEPRQLLHASQLTFRHPVTGAEQTLRSPAQALLTSLYRELERGES